MLTVGSLFAGIGGIELGLERTGGFKTVWQVENDRFATRVLERHWPGVRRWGDVRTFPPDASGSRFSNGVECEGCQTKKRNVIDSYKTWHVDLICGGFPCQDISYAGKGAGLDGERSGLFYEAARIIRTLGPRYVLLENVAALLSRGLGDVLGTLASLGYDAEWHCIPAAAVGAPHRRDRVYIVAYAASNRRKTSLQHLRLLSETSRCDGGNWNGERLDKPGIERVADGVPARVDRLKCLGNAVVPQVAYWVGQRILSLEGER